MMTPHSILKSRRIAGFTVVELLVVIAILFVLVGILMVALRTGRRSATLAESLNALRQITNAYNSYATEHKGRLMPGYIDPADFGTGPNQITVKTTLRHGYDLLADPEDASSYVWRLAPYLDHDWEVFMTDYRDRQLVGVLEAEYGTGTAGNTFGGGSAAANQFGIARVPSYGLNSIFLGGDSRHGPAPDHAPWRGGRKTFIASRLSDVLNPAKIVVFGACKAENVSLPASSSVLGYCELRPPQAYNAAEALEPQWIVDTSGNAATDGQAILQVAGPAGLPFSRLEDDRVPVSHLDGSTENEYLTRLATDMSRWAPKAVSSN